MSSEEPSFTDEVSNNMLKELQSWWEIPSMAQYISLFREPFHLPEIEIEELEKGFIDDTIRGPNEWLQNLIIAFLKSIMPSRINAENWEDQLRKLIRRKWPETPFSDKAHPFEEDKPFHQLQLRSKVEVVYCFCLCRLDKNDIVEHMKSMDADALRVQKLGTDDAGNTYWYFYGTRLYKEEPIDEKKSWDQEWKEQKRKSFKKKRGRGRPRKRQPMSDGESDSEIGQKDSRYMNVSEKSRWSVVCDTIEEWVNFAEKFKNSKSKTEKNLFQIIQENFLPTLNQIYEEKERKLQEKIRDLMPSREKILTRTETRRLRGDDVRVDYSKLNGYYSDEEEQDHLKRQSQPQPPPVIRDRAQRLEERRKRASEINETNGSFSTPTNKKAKHDGNDDSEEEYSNYQMPENKEVDIQGEMEKVLTNVKLHKDAWPFLYPVDERDAPGYYEIIKDPIDLSKIESRLYNGDYETVGDLDGDFSKMVSNCELFNGEYHDYSKMAQTLRKMFRKQVAKLLESLEAVESEHADSEGSRDSQPQSSSNSASSAPESPPMQVQHSKERKKSKHKKRKRAMEALDLLAKASEEAVQNSNSNDMLSISNLYDGQKQLSNDFNLKILPIHSHPPSYIEKYSSNSPKENTYLNHEKDSSLLNQISNTMLDHGQQLRSSPSDSGISTSSETISYMHNLTHLSNFMEKNGIKNLNISSNSDMSNVLSDSNSSNNGSVKETAHFHKDPGSPDSLHGLDNILGEYPENLIFHLMKQPICNSDGFPMPQSKDNFSPTYIESFSKGDTNCSKATTKSPSFIPTSERVFFQENPNIQYDLGSPSNNLATIDASVLGISSNNMSKKPRYTNIPAVDENHASIENDDTVSNSTEQEVATKKCHSIRLKQRISSNDMNQHFEPFKNIDIDQNVRSKQRTSPNEVNQYFEPPKIMDIDQNIRSKQRTSPNEMNQHFEPPKIMDIDQNIRSKQRTSPNEMNQHFEPPKIMDIDQNIRSKQRTSPNEMNQHFEPPKIMDIDQNIRSKQRTLPNNMNQYCAPPIVMENDQNVRSKKNTFPGDMNKSLESSNISSFDQALIRSKQRISTNNINQHNESSNTANCDQTVRPNKRTSPNETSQCLEPFNNMQAVNVSNNSYLSCNMGMANPQNNLPTTFIQTIPTYSSSNMPLQVPALYPKSYQPPKMQMQSQNYSVRVDEPPSNDQSMFLPRTVAEQTFYYHMYAQKQRHNSVQDHRNTFNDVSAVPMQVASNDEKRIIKQDNSLNRTSPPQKSPEPQEKMTAPVHVPSTSMPFNPVSASTTISNRPSLPASSSNFNLANPVVQIMKMNRPAIVAPTKVSESNKRTFPNNNIITTSLNTASGAKNNSSAVPQKSVFQPSRAKTVPPIVVSGYNSASPSDQSNLRIKNPTAAMTLQSTLANTMTVQSNPAAVMTMQSNSAASAAMQPNVCMPNRLPVVQIIPAGSQQFLSNNGQFVLASPQNTVGLYAKGQNVQMQNNVGQLNQSFGKVVPQYLASAPIMQVNKDALQNLQFQTLTQSTQPFTQVTQSPQYVNIPYMLTNQNVINNPSSQSVMNVQPYQLTQRQVQISSQGNG